MEQIKMDDFLKYKYISSFKANPSKNKACFIVGKAHIDKNEYRYELHTLINNKTKKIGQLRKDSQVIWENDHQLLFPYKKNKLDEKKAKDKYSIFYRFDLNTNKLSPAFELPMQATILKSLGNDKHLVSAQLTSAEHHLYLDQASDREKSLKKLKEQSSFEDINELPFYANGVGFIANKRNQLFIYDEQKKKIDLIVDPDFNVGKIVVSNDLKHIYYTGKQAKSVKSLTTHIYVYHVETKITDILYHEDDYAISQLYHLDQRIIVEATDMKTYGVNQNSHFYELKNKKLVLFKSYGLSTSPSVGSDVRLGANQHTMDHQDAIYFVRTTDDHNELMKMDLEGNIEKIYEMNGSIDSICFVNQKLFIVGLHKQKLQEIYRVESENLIQVSRVNSGIFKLKYVAKPKTFIYNQKGHDVKGFVLYPKDYDEKKSYPAILDIHGGPKTVYGKVYYHEMQVWASMGYFVLFANPRGSDGKGDDFADIRGKYGSIDYDDLMGFTDTVLKKVKQINRDRLYVTGGSYGGFMTNWIVGHTNMFKAAATQRSIANWISFYGTSDIGFYFSKDQTAGHPIIDTDLLWQQSPMKYALNVETPLLFIHSDEDYRCPIEQAMQYYAILKEKGLDTKFVWFKGETHELSRSGKPQARLKRLKEITSWFESHKS